MKNTRWVEIKGTSVVGQVVERIRRPDGPVLVIDVNGGDGIFYAEESDVRDVHSKLVPNATVQS